MSTITTNTDGMKLALAPATNSTPTVTYEGAEDVNRAIAAAKRANEMPLMKVLHSEEDFDSGVVTTEHLLPLSVELKKAQLLVEAVVTSEGARDKECYCAVQGTHTVYGNFVKLWSVRGPGNGLRQRPMFLFYDGEPVFIS